MKIFSVSCLLFFSVGCGSTYNHSTKRWEYNPECVANRKDGRDSQCSDQTWNYVPEIQNRQQNLRAYGKVICAIDMVQTPLNGARVDLLALGNVVASTVTDQEGKFLLMTSSKFDSQAEYFVQIQSKCGIYKKQMRVGADGQIDLQTIYLK